MTSAAATSAAGSPDRRDRWEQLASRTALDQLAGKETEALARKARGGDVTAAQVLDTYGERVGTGLVTLLAIFRPDRVVIAGGAARFFDLFGRGLRCGLDRGPKYTPKPAVIAAELGNLSGAIGAAVMTRGGPGWKMGHDDEEGD